MGSQHSRSHSGRTKYWIAIAFCAAVAAGWALENFIGIRSYETDNPGWIPPIAAGLAIVGIIIQIRDRPRLLHLRRAIIWSGLLLMVWSANGLPLDLLRLTPLMPSGLDWPATVTKMFALASAVTLAYLALARQSIGVASHPATWYGYAAFVLALPYPVLRTIWALGGTIGLEWKGAAGQGFEPWLAGVPWLLASALSLLLVPTWRRVPRRLLLAAGWAGTAIVGMIGPAACWSLVTKSAVGGGFGLDGIVAWVPILFYGSWLLWGIAAGAATLSYQLRSERLQKVTSHRTNSFGGKTI